MWESSPKFIAGTRCSRNSTAMAGLVWESTLNFIALIPKIKGTRKLRISERSASQVIKNFAEVSIKEIIPSIIQGKQCALVKIRTIYNGLSANERVGHYRAKKKKGLPVKLYRGKTYNRVIYGVCFG